MGLSMGTIMVMGGAGLVLGILDYILETMGKGYIGKMISTIAFIGLGIYTVYLLEDLFFTLSRLFL